MSLSFFVLLSSYSRSSPARFCDVVSVILPDWEFSQTSVLPDKPPLCSLKISFNKLEQPGQAQHAFLFIYSGCLHIPPRCKISTLIHILNIPQFGHELGAFWFHNTESSRGNADCNNANGSSVACAALYASSQVIGLNRQTC